MKKGLIKKILLVLFVLAVIAAGGIFYVNQFVLPVKIKSLIIENIEKTTQKKASLETVQFNIFKGLVLRGFELRDGPRKLLSLKEASCSFLILPIFKEKRIIIPAIRIQEPVIFLERGADNTFNLMELLPNKSPAGKEQPLGLIISGISIAGGRIDFQDNSLSPAFAQTIDDINLSVSFSLPVGVKFNLRCNLRTSPLTAINASGEFHLLNKNLDARISINNLPPKELFPYYADLGVSVKEGNIDAAADIKLKDNLITAQITAQAKNLLISQDKLFIKLNSAFTARINYNLKTKEIKYSGGADIVKASISGIELIQEISDIAGKINFSDTGISADKLTASLLGLQAEAKINLSDFSRPRLRLEAASGLALEQAQNTLLERFKISIPAKVSGQARLSLNLDTQLPIEGLPPIKGSLKVFSASLKSETLKSELKNINGLFEFDLDKLRWSDLSLEYIGIPFKTSGEMSDFKSPFLNLSLSSDELKFAQLRQMLSDEFKIKIPADISGGGRMLLNLKTRLPSAGIETIELDGSVDIASAAVKIDNVERPFEDINGSLKFSSASVSWDNLKFSYLNTPYVSSATIANFKSPLINLILSSSELQLKSRLGLAGKQIKINNLEARYLDSQASIQGNVDISDSQAIGADIEADMNINLEDLKKPLAKFKDKIEQIKPSGAVKAKVRINGIVNDFKNCSVDAKLSASLLSFYGLKAEEFLLDYSQSAGLADVPLARLSMYDGTIDASAKINLAGENLPFWVNTAIQGVNIAKLKQDTPIKNQDISGTIQAISKVNGFLSQPQRLSGSGKISIKEGRLWQLNFFKGIGELLFTKDFANVVFNEGYCEFFIKDEFIFTDNLQLKSNLVNLEGRGKVGFDSSLEATINTQVGDEIPPAGGLKDITTAIIGQAGRFGVIKLSGTLQNPKYKFQPAVTDVMKGLKDTILGSIFGQ